MIYLIKEDLISLAYERLIDESVKDSDTVINDIELQQIEFIKSYLSTRYDVDKIFDTEKPMRNGILIVILSTLVVYAIFRRNAARKMAEDYPEEYKKAMALLDKVATGSIVPEGLPPAKDDNGNSMNRPIWGSNSNDNNYI